MRAFGFGEVFISWIKILYMNASCILKIGGGLSKPISMLKGIRQGCPLSGQLYALAVEPLLCLLRKELSGVNIDEKCNGVKLIAYADDITVFVKDQRDVDVVIYSISIYEKASSARMNWSKTEAFWCNDKEKHCNVITKPIIPGNVKWEKEGFKFLGIFLGSEFYQRKNWEGIKDKIYNRLSKWNWILPQLSYRGRVLVANNLAASTLWHKLIVLNPPEELIREIQRMLVNFFWNGQHWLREAVLYLPLSEGGQGLMDLKSKVASFRLQIAQRILYSQPQNWINIACALLKRVGRMNLDKHLFLMNLKEVDFNGLTSFYASVFNVWQIFMVKRELSEVTYDWVLEEPLIFNPLFSNGMIQSKGISASFVKAGICKIGHLRIWHKWITAEELALNVGIHSVRTVEHFLTEIQEYVMALPLLEERVEKVFPSIRVGINVGDYDI